MNRHTRHLPLLAILLFAAVVRIVHLIDILHDDQLLVPILDARSSLAWAAELASGDWGVGRPYWMAPLYPHLLALPAAVFGATPLAPVVLQMILGLVNLVLFHRLATRLTDGRTALVATALWAGYAPAVFYAGFVIVATVLTTVMLLIAGAAAEAHERPNRRRLLILGALIGLGALGRGNIALLAPAMVLLRLREDGAARALRQGAWVVLGAAICMAPVTARNILVGGDFVPISSNAGMNLAIGQDHSADGVFVPLHSDPSGHYDPTGRLRLEEEQGRSLKPSEVSDLYARRAWRSIVDDPAAWARHTLRKSLRLVSGYELPQLAAFEVSRDGSLPLRLMPVPYWFLSLGGLVGLFALKGRGRRVVVLLTAVYLISLVPFFPTARFRQPVAPLLALSSAALIMEWVRARAGGVLGSRRMIGLGAALLAAAVVTWPGWTALDPDQVRWQSLMHDAKRAELAGRPYDAVGCFERAAELLPGLPDTWYNLGQFYRRLGNDAAALAAFRDGQTLAPRDRLFPYHIGRLHLRAGRHGDAAAAYRRSIDLDPTWAKPVFGLGMVGRASGDLAAADSLFRRATEMAPGNPRYRNNLALIQAERGDLAEAERMLADLLGDFPGYGRGWINLGLVRMGAGDRLGVAEVVNRLDAFEGLTSGELGNLERLKRFAVGGG